MATFYITEFADLAVIGSAHSIEAGHQPPVAEQTVAIGAEAKSSAFNAKTTYVRVHADAICSFLFGDAGASPTATTASGRMVAGQTEYFAVQPAAKVSVIANT